MKTSFSVSLGAMLLVTSGTGSTNEISETMAMAVRGTLSSPKQPYELEVCVADAITQIGGAVPIPLRNGERSVMMLGYGHTPKLIVSLNAVPTGTLLEIRTRSGDMDNKLIRHLRNSCRI